MIKLIFLLWICTSAVADAKYRKCFNWLIVLGFGVALMLATLNSEFNLYSISIYDRLIGFFSAFLVFFIFYFLKMMGAGDVKFAAVLGACIGWQLLLPIWGVSCFFAVIHSVVVRSDFKYFFLPLVGLPSGGRGESKRFIPYVTYISMATVIVLLMDKY